MPDTRVAKCLELMRQRGPDSHACVDVKSSEGFSVQLLHSRLNILDLDERSNQPFGRRDNILSYNGEIYNYVEVRNRLRMRGHKFNTTGDTEVLATLLDEGGVGSLTECEGMWALSWWHGTSETLWLSRDRFGEKPLYYMLDANEGMYFGSEPKFIFALLGRKLPVNPQHLLRFIVNGYKSLYKSDETFFLGMKSISPGTSMMFTTTSQPKAMPYWDPHKVRESRLLSFEEVVLGTRERLTRALELRLRSDVPLAFCLSGGIDSSALAAVAHKVLDADVQGYTVLSRDKRYNEFDRVQEIVAHLGIKNQFVEVPSQGFIENLRRLTSYHDAPVATITYFVQWHLMRAIAGDGYKVSISGTAADELFSGYYDHHLAYLRDVKLQSKALYDTARLQWELQVAPHVRNPFLQDADYFILRPNSRDHIYLGAEDTKAALKVDFSESFSERAYTDQLLRNRMLNELFHETVPLILHEDDLNSMYYSVENRSPYLDSNLYSWSRSIPTEYLIYDGLAKAPLRWAVSDLLPQGVALNPHKVGFNASLSEFLPDNSSRAQEIVRESVIAEWFEPEWIESLFDKEVFTNSQSKLAFSVLTSAMFLEEYA